MIVLLKPWFPLAINLTIFILALGIYRTDIASNQAVALMSFGLFGTAVLTWGATLKHPELALPKPRDLPFKNVLSAAIVLSSVLEYWLLGIPLLGNVIYAEFGFPLLHHVSVSSWILVFTTSQLRNRWIKVLLLCFAMANPILMLNRDVLLLTLFSLGSVAVIRRRLSTKSFIAVAIGALALFGYLGEGRSPGALQLIDLPFAIDASELPTLVLWPLIYITSSSFNMLFNFDTLQTELYSPLINVFPEAFRWATLSGSLLAMCLFYLVVGVLLVLLKVLAHSYPTFVPLYIYFLYQAYMGAFSTKFFTTNSVFTVIIFLSLALASLHFRQTQRNPPELLLDKASVH